ncbi:TetR/AcrR family transcriptional regulator [Bacillus safensis]|uniref:TetR/AcrR family transcriptional regulator n=1 Tax=Bacillus safensis TaxID=561879 RepID=UPI000B44C1BA|nr:TetR/AcrR family transcriptional regulator [Bacillus safensis]MCY7493666.1 TetR/AcrR family transcriptional regulator [Bacillus safensis]MED4993109.1 TetR/AcrR family transcriptional regulator [Bacillus safensis]UDB46001.1 TetR/AcrR family transcriptional regulator [Bacillus safensis]
MTANCIKESALTHFAEKGYEGTSLFDIAKEVGIKKQSIYSHFKHKDDLFLQVMHQVIQEETFFLNNFFENHHNQSLHDTLYTLIVRYKERYLEAQQGNIKFLLRMAFMPPTHLQEVVIPVFNAYYAKLENFLKDFFMRTEGLYVNADEGAISFLNFLDGLFVELIYSSVEKFNVRLNFSWKIYWRGIAKIELQLN